MKALTKRKLLNYAIFVFGAYLLECVSFAFMGWGFFPIYFFLDLLLILVLGAPIFFFRNRVFDLVWITIWIIGIGILCCLNANFYVATGTIFSFQDFRLLTGGITVLGTASAFINAKIIATEAAVVFVALFSLFFINIRYPIKIKKKKKTKTVLVVSLLSMLFAMVLYPTTLYLTSEFNHNADHNLTTDQVNLSKNYNYRHLGMLTYYIKDIQSTYFNHNAYSIDEIKDFCLDGKKEENNYTGLLKNKDMNVMTVMIETGAMAMVNYVTNPSFLTPNLNNVMQNGVNCTHNYSKNKTQISEYIGISGNYSTNGLDPDYEYAIPFTLPNVLNNDYHTMFFHDAGDPNDIYNRAHLIPHIGFEHTYLHNDLFPDTPMWEWQAYSLDTEITDKVIEKLEATETDKPFYAFYTTLTMHGPYIRNDAGKEYFQKLDNLYLDKLNQAKAAGIYNNPLKGTIDEECFDNYMLKVMDFDAALGKLFNYLYGPNKKNDTLLLLYGDHDVYYPGKSGKRMSSLLYQTDDIEQIKQFHTILTFYDPSTDGLNATYQANEGKLTFDKFTTPNVIVPTILDLLGYNYSTSLYLGNSIFNIHSSEEEIFYSFEFGAFLNEHFFSQTNLYIDKAFDDSKSQNQFLNSATKLINKLLRINAIYKDNMFKDQNFEDFLPK